MGTAGARAWQLVEAGYTLTLATGSCDLHIRTAGQPATFTLPLTALVGRSALPAPTAFVAAAGGAALTLDTAGGASGLLLTTVVTGSPSFFTVKVVAAAGPSPATPNFFDGGTPATVMTPVAGGYTPDPSVAALSPDPTVVVGELGSRYSEPFAPPPLMVGLHTPVGWVGLGLVGVPNASIIGYQPGGGLAVNYPLATLATFADRGAGGRVGPPTPVAGAPPAAAGTWLGFPRFVVTIAATAPEELTAYDQALSALGQASVAFPPGTRPAWWSWPVADTWGQQFLVDGLGSKRPFTSGWVLSMVAAWQQRFGLQHFTVVIDAGWESRLGSAIPSAGFGGIAGMRRLIDTLHAEGLRVVLWWPLWLAQSVTGGQRRIIDPTLPGFPAATQAAMRILLGSGPGELDADGLKYDWGYIDPQPVTAHYANPADGLGAAALFHYMQILARAAWTVQPQALIDGGAAAPQFDSLESMLRLYDALTSLQWSARAAIAAAADPEVALDGDGFIMDGGQALSHIVSSAVYGTPALYYATQWAGGQPIPLAEAHTIGLILNLSAERGQGEALALPDGAWAYVVHGVVTARTLGDLAMVVFRTSPCGAIVGGTVVGAAAGPVTMPLPPGVTAVQVADAGNPALSATIAGGAAAFTIAAGIAYQLTLSGATCA